MSRLQVRECVPGVLYQVEKVSKILGIFPTIDIVRSFSSAHEARDYVKELLQPEPSSKIVYRSEYLCKGCYKNDIDYERGECVDCSH